MVGRGETSRDVKPLNIPRAIDELLGRLGTWPGLSAEMGSRLFSASGRAMRAFSESPPNIAELDQAIQRVERCLAVIDAAPSHPDAAIASDLWRLLKLLQSPRDADAPPGDSPSVEPQPLEPSPAAPSSRRPPIRPPRSDQPFQPRLRAAIPEPAVETTPVMTGPRSLPRSVAEAAVGYAERDWYRFVLVELNGLGTALTFQREQQESETAARTELRIRAMVDALSWNATSALRETWAFVEECPLEPEDAWAPAMVFSALEPKSPRARSWLASLPPRTQAAIDQPRIEGQKGLE